MKHEIKILSDAEAAAVAVAELIRDKAVSKKQHGQLLNVAVSGGSTPKYLFGLLAGEDFRNSIPWENVRLFWVDERCVEPTHPESNFGMTYDALLQYAFIPGENIFRMKGEDIPQNEKVRYAGILRKELPAKNGFPVFDLILLGMGDDGHTASIFPDNLALFESDNTVGVAVHPATGQKRITLTGKTINQAESIVFLVTGVSKATIIAEIINKKAGYQQYPASHIEGIKNPVCFYLDKESAGLL